MIKKIGFVVYAVTDIAKARAFYENIIGLTPNPAFADSKSWVEYDIGPDTLAIGCSPDWKPSPDGAVAALEVDNFDEMIADLKAKNASFKMEAMDFPSCHMAVLNDPDNNKIMIHKIKSR